MSKTIRADQVGSLLRPQALLDARRAHEAGALADAALREVEDAAIRDALALQAEAGIEVVSDGEFRRSAWGNGLIDSLTGMGTAARAYAERTGGARRWQGEHSDLAHESLPERKVVTGKVGLSRRFAAEEARFLAANAGRPFKITMPSPTMFNRLWDKDLSSGTYPDVDALMEDLVGLYLEEVDALHAIGVPYLQLDSLRYIDTIDAVEKGQIAAADARDTLASLVAVDNRVLGRMKRAGVTRGVHICRGNHRSAWAVTGSYESVAEFLLGQVDADRFLMEFDSERAGGFEPLRFVPRGRIVVLGLVTTKTGALEDPDALCRRIDEAAKIVPLEDLAISPQCGFASTELGNLLTVDEQKRKLALVVEVARRVWG
ncbi:5-methyltetrahydropteroyltriglutamate--homocysteine S-methyltransferase [Sphingomonas canadensis]|uniref:5-methyltetrahydropteroyltriglutamate--homocysteine S-methyltransferase n=1 Tax=Sphingomonas canadensis TaxID=1219257 RepID=A0ABW3HH24_9SPHN|nr:5-methyltetrahydropteroyltriglutamate--homocysteine S-methyltransferase [Sphingomonas canadensis]MCW3838339.1 5-methyltetrahydropteroyltriglutamate--homocysteine S-methyltransferase [Sphingomonas canadensis]